MLTTLTCARFPHAAQSSAVTETEEFKSLRRLALANLGRNVLHFQRLEARLKILVLFCGFEAPQEQFAAAHKERTQSIRKKTMGAVVSELHEQLYGRPADPEVTKAITAAHVSFQFRVDADPDYLDQQKKRLTDLVSERNELIHHDLASFDPTSAGSCRHWITRLDEQNERILSQLKAVEQLINTGKESFQILLASMNSDEYRRQL